MEAYYANGSLGVLTFLMEHKLIYEDEYELIRKILTSPSPPPRGPHIVLDRMATTATPKQKVQAEDIFDFVGSLAPFYMKEGKCTLKLVNCKGGLGKQPFVKRNLFSGNSWKNRYFVLQGNQISYFVKKDEKLKGRILLSGDSFIRDAGGDNMFDVHTTSGVLKLKTSSHIAKLTWVAAIARSIQSIRLDSSFRLTQQIPSHAVTDVGLRESDDHQKRDGRSWSLSVSKTLKNSGYLQYYNSHGDKTWVQKYFSIYRNLLSYYQKEGDEKPISDFILDIDTKIKRGKPPTMTIANTKSPEAIFHIAMPGKNDPLVLCANSKEEMEEWITALDYALECDEFTPDEADSAESVANLMKPDMLEIEVIVANRSEAGSTAKSIGILILTRNDNLPSIRKKLFEQLDAIDIPEDFNFLLNRATGDGDSVKVAEKDILKRVLRGRYTKIGQDQEYYFGVDKFVEDGNRLLLLGIEENASHKPKGGIQQLPLPPVPKKDSSEEHQEGNEETEKDDSPIPHMDVRMYENTIRRLKAQLAEARSTIVQLQQQSGSLGSSKKPVSPMEAALIMLQKDGYIEETVSTKELSKEYMKRFDQEDLSGVILSTGGPFETLFRRYAGNPQFIRDFLYNLQGFLDAYKIPKLRLSEPWWRRTLREPTFLTRDAESLMKWASEEPWCEDTPERYSYLMTKMRPGTVTEAHTRIIGEIPEYVSEDESNSEDEGDGDSEEPNSPRTFVAPAPPKPMLAFLGEIQNKKR